MNTYGDAPVDLGPMPISLSEYMHYMYLPVVMDGPEIRLPGALESLRSLIAGARENTGGKYRYCYVTARRGYATPDNPLNRPGWHTDGFGTDDTNFIWCDVFPTRFAVQEFEDISDSHVDSAQQFTDQVLPRNIEHAKTRHVYKLSPFVVHATPSIPAPGGERSFIKISFSNSKYNLEGNSHNYLFDYDWKMYTREEVRNDPAKAESDSV